MYATLQGFKALKHPSSHYCRVRWPWGALLHRSGACMAAHVQLSLSLPCVNLRRLYNAVRETITQSCGLRVGTTASTPTRQYVGQEHVAAAAIRAMDLTGGHAFRRYVQAATRRRDPSFREHCETINLLCCSHAGMHVGQPAAAATLPWTLRHACVRRDRAEFGRSMAASACPVAEVQL